MTVQVSQTDPSNGGTGAQKPLLEVTALKKYFPIQRGFLKQVVGHVKAVDDVNFYVNKGETLGLVGESGCGKTTTGRCVIRAIDPTSGRVWYQDPTLGRVDITELNQKQVRVVRRSIRMIFQDPYASLNPRMDSARKLSGRPSVQWASCMGRKLRSAWLRC